MTDIPSLPEAHRRVAVAYLEALSLDERGLSGPQRRAVGFVGRLSGSEARILLIASVEPVASALRVSENPSRPLESIAVSRRSSRLPSGPWAKNSRLRT